MANHIYIRMNLRIIEFENLNASWSSDNIYNLINILKVNITSVASRAVWNPTNFLTFLCFFIYLLKTIILAPVKTT